jgi:hypothetical protein
MKVKNIDGEDGEDSEKKGELPENGSVDRR